MVLAQHVRLRVTNRRDELNRLPTHSYSKDRGLLSLQLQAFNHFIGNPLFVPLACRIVTLSKGVSV